MVYFASELWYTWAMLTKKECKEHFKTKAAAARAIGMSKSYFQKLADPLPPHYACQFEVVTSGKLKSGFVNQDV